MTILIFYTRNLGYLSQFFEELSICLAQEGHEIHNFSLKSRAYEQNENDVLLTVKKRGGYIKNYYEIFKIIKSLKPDVIISNFSYVNPALLFGRLLGVKQNMAWFHSLNDQTGATYSNIFIKKSFLRLADVIIANSHHTKEELHQEFKVARLKIKTIPFWCSINQDGIGFGDVPRDKNTLKIGCPGRLVAHKNQRIVLEALASFRKKDFEFHLAGTGPDKEILLEQAKQLGLVDQVVFRDHLTANEMIAFYKDMDVIVLPSLSEAFGLVFIEAISLGTPVVVSSQFGALTFIESEKDLESITFNPTSVEALKTKLIPYFNNTKPSSGYFKTLYSKNFDKKLIYNRLHQIVLGGEEK